MYPFLASSFSFPKSTHLMKTLHFPLIVSLLVLFTLSACSKKSTDVAPAPAAAIAGTYLVTGFEQDKQQYQLVANSRITYTLIQESNEQVQLIVKQYKDGQLVADIDHGLRSVKREGNSLELYEDTLLIGEYVDQTLYITFGSMDANNRQIVCTYSAKKQ